MVRFHFLILKTTVLSFLVTIRFGAFLLGFEDGWGGGGWQIVCAMFYTLFGIRLLQPY